MTEQRVRASETRYRISDVCVVLGETEYGDIVETAPLVCIEVLSPDDRLPGVQQRLNDYVRMGVQNIWVFDPVTHAVWIVEDAALRQVTGTEILVNGTGMTFSTTDVFMQFERRLYPRSRTLVV